MLGCAESEQSRYDVESVTPKGKAHYSTDAVLPGNGASMESCGRHVAYHCNSCGQPFWSESKCLERTCPKCYEAWASKEASTASKRMAWGYKVLRKTMLDSGIRKKPRLVHVVISVHDRGTVEELRNEAYRIAKFHGITGNLTVFHPFRKDKYDGRYTLQDCVHFHIIGFAPKDIVQGGVDVDLDTAFEYMTGRMMDLPMIFMRHRGMTDWPDAECGASVEYWDTRLVYEAWFPSDDLCDKNDMEHGQAAYHVVGQVNKRRIGGHHTWVVAGSPEMDEWCERIVRKSIKRTRPFFMVVEDDEYKDYRGFRHGLGIKRCVQYLLTHCGIVEEMHALTWSGSVSYQSLPEYGWDAGYYLREDKKLRCFHMVWREARTGILDLYPHALDPDPKVNPKCPVCGSRDTEPCNVWDSTTWYNRHEVIDHPEPDWSPEQVGLYEALWRAIAKSLVKDIMGVARKGMTLDQIHSVFANTEGEATDRVIDWNVKSGRLVVDKFDKLWFGPPVYNLYKATNEMKYIPTTAKGDDKLRAMILSVTKDTNGIETDTDFVFGPLLERFERGCGGC